MSSLQHNYMFLSCAYNFVFRLNKVPPALRVETCTFCDAGDILKAHLCSVCVSQSSQPIKCGKTTVWPWQSSWQSHTLQGARDASGNGSILWVLVMRHLHNSFVGWWLVLSEQKTSSQPQINTSSKPGLPKGPKESVKKKIPHTGDIESLDRCGS